MTALLVGLMWAASAENAVDHRSGAHRVRRVPLSPLARETLARLVLRFACNREARVTKHEEIDADLWVLIEPAHLPGQWVAHCLTLDLVTQGNSIAHAFEMATEAITLVVRDDLEADRDPLKRSETTPQESWDELMRVLRRGHRVTKLSEMTSKDVAAVAISCQLTVEPDPKFVEKAPPAWMVASHGHSTLGTTGV